MEEAPAAADSGGFPPSPEVVLRELAEAPARLARLLRDAPDGGLDRAAADDGWTARETLAYLADLELNVHWTAVVARLLYEPAPLLAAPPAEEAALRRLEHGYRYQDPQTALGAFTLARRHLVAALRALPPEAWRRTSASAHGTPRTLLEVVAGIARHDRLQLARLSALLAPPADRPRGREA